MELCLSQKCAYTVFFRFNGLSSSAYVQAEATTNHPVLSALSMFLLAPRGCTLSQALCWGFAAITGFRLPQWTLRGVSEVLQVVRATKSLGSNPGLSVSKVALKTTVDWGTKDAIQNPSNSRLEGSDPNPPHGRHVQHAGSHLASGASRLACGQNLSSSARHSPPSNLSSASY